MTQRPYMKFYPSDWRGEPRLKMCSLSARGLWIEFLSYMHEGTPRGHLTINGRTPSLSDICALVGRPLAEVRKALAELENHNVFDRSPDGTIVSRRMVRDTQKSIQGQAAATNRWGTPPNGLPNGSPNGSADAEPNGSPNGGGCGPPITPESRVQSPEIQKPESKKEEDPANAGLPPKFVFESGVIRLKQKDFDQWQRAFKHLNLMAELLSLSEWAAKQKSWFPAVSAALAKRDREVLQRMELSKQPPEVNRYVDPRL